ncbi:hypothetical protein [Methyloprofundus sp.]|uniref:hypothetical protein n=1 Tax=Methyloprofundus sp. TaxID=2020875 RepID=UPI003D12AB47
MQTSKNKPGLYIHQFRYLVLIALLANTHICIAGKTLVHSIDFSSHSDADALPWLKKKGYIFKLDANDIEVTFKNKRLNFATTQEKAGIFGLQLAPDNYLQNITSIEIEWGVVRQPVGANWESGKNRVPIALMFFFGTEKISSGLPFGINSAPFFLSPFIGLKETPGKAYIGKLYKKGGRYICMATTEGSEEVIKSTIMIDPKYLEHFHKHKIPPLTAIAFQMNTKDTKGGAHAFIRKLKFFAN